MARASIVCDDWKLPVFRRRLQGAGFRYEDAGEFTPNTTALIVETNDLVGLADVVRAANLECKKAGPPKNVGQ